MVAIHVAVETGNHIGNRQGLQPPHSRIKINRPIDFVIILFYINYKF